MKTDNINIIPVTNLNDEDRELILSHKKVHATERTPCPRCGLDTITEDTYGYEKVSSCSHCDYSSTVNL
jgi:ribosomal protein L37E